MGMTYRTLNQIIDIIQDHSYIDEETGCWIYTKRINHNGYGMINYNGQPWLVHRLIFKEVMFKDLPLVVCHKCDNPPCWNPEHLFGGTPQDNIDDMVTKGRQNKGIAHHRAVLTDDLVREIREAGRIMSYKDVGLAYGIDACAVRKIVLRKAWKHVTEQ